MRPATAALHGDLDGLILAHSRYPRLGMTTMLNAARSGSLRCMRFAYMHGAGWHPKTTAVAARGQLACLEYAFFNGAPWHPLTTENAAKGHLSCLRFCQEHGLAVWSKMISHNAARSSNVACLRFAVENGAPRHELVIETSVRNVLDNPQSASCRDTLTYAVDANFPYCARLASRAGEVALVMEVRRQLHQIRVIQRAWRARPALMRARQAVEDRKRRAVDVIQLAYLTWTFRPNNGASYKRARASYKSLSDSM